jgi:glycosyltransferase involved in cell wall biosynthesis
MFNSELTSIVIPCRNQARFLGESIASALGQSHREIEIIVVDDGSTDETVETARSFSDVRCLSLLGDGLASARNAGLNECNGYYILFLDADDRLLPHAIEEGIRCLGEHPECAFAYGHVKLIAIDGSPLPTPRQLAVASNHYVELLRRNFIWTTGAVLYRREALDLVGGFNPAVAASADFDLNARMARRFPVCCTDTTTLEYRRHPNSMSHDYSVMLRSAVTARRLQWKAVKGNRIQESALRAGIRAVQQDYGEKLIEHAGALMRERMWREAAEQLSVLLRYYPRGLARLCSTRPTMVRPPSGGPCL